MSDGSRADSPARGRYAGASASQAIVTLHLAGLLDVVREAVREELRAHHAHLLRDVPRDGSDDRWLGVAQVARRLGFTEPTIRTWCRTGKLPAQRVGRRWKVRESDLAAVRDGNGDDVDTIDIEEEAEAMAADICRRRAS